MKRAYYLLHVVAIPLYLLLTYLAFVMLIPFYLIVVFGGFSFWQAFVEQHATQKILRAVLVGIFQAAAFLLLVLVEFALVSLPLGVEQLKLAASLGAWVGAGFVLISVVTTVLSERHANAAIIGDRPRF